MEKTIEKLTNELKAGDELKTAWGWSKILKLEPYKFGVSKLKNSKIAFLENGPKNTGSYEFVLMEDESWEVKNNVEKETQ